MSGDQALLEQRLLNLVERLETAVNGLSSIVTEIKKEDAEHASASTTGVSHVAPERR